MSEGDGTVTESVVASAWQRHRFFGLVAVVIMIASFLVSVSLGLYNSSGAAQLDLSRPGYQDVRDQAGRDTTDLNYPASGPLTKQAFSEFMSLYDEQVKKATTVDSYSATALAEESLHLLGPSQAAPTATIAE
ncbi:MAG: hypothetical protein WAQ25_03990 [Candidatus Saccharimonas sp.]